MDFTVLPPVLYAKGFGLFIFRFYASRILRSEPPAHDDFLLGVKRYGVFAVGVQVSEEGILPSREGEKAGSAEVVAV
jgi:hypothetical protein